MESHRATDLLSWKKIIKIESSAQTACLKNKPTTSLPPLKQSVNNIMNKIYQYLKLFNFKIAHEPTYQDLACVDLVTSLPKQHNGLIFLNDSESYFVESTFYIISDPNLAVGRLQVKKPMFVVDLWCFKIFTSSNI